MFDREPISHTGITDNYQFECQDSDFEFVGQGCHFPIGIWIKGWTVARILEIVTIHMRSKMVRILVEENYHWSNTSYWVSQKKLPF